MPKTASKHMVRFRVDFTSLCSVGPGKVDLLESIERLGSLRKAAQELHMSYAYGWLLLNDLNRSFGEPVTSAKMGGHLRGGMTLTAFGKRLVRCYRSASRAIESAVQADLEPIANKAVSLPSRKLGAPRKRQTRGVSLLRSRVTGT
jgi:molybdate transport system regulatory protein